MREVTATIRKCGSKTEHVMAVTFDQLIARAPAADVARYLSIVQKSARKRHPADLTADDEARFLATIELMTKRGKYKVAEQLLAAMVRRGGSKQLGIQAMDAGAGLARGSVIALLDRVAEVLESRGKYRLAAVVDATANDLLEQRDDMLDWTGFDDVMKRSEDIADHISKERIEPWDVSELYNERPQ